MPDLYPVTLDDMIAEIKRELTMRAQYYPLWKRKAGIVKIRQLDRQMEVMAAILDYLEKENTQHDYQKPMGQ